MVERIIQGPRPNPNQIEIDRQERERVAVDIEGIVALYDGETETIQGTCQVSQASDLPIPQFRTGNRPLMADVYVVRGNNLPVLMGASLKVENPDTDGESRVIQRLSWSAASELEYGTRDQMVIKAIGKIAAAITRPYSVS
jgi:hypothetical protein